MKTKSITLHIPVSQYAYIESAFETSMRAFLHDQITGWIESEMPFPLELEVEKSNGGNDRAFFNSKCTDPRYVPARRRIDEILSELGDRSLAKPKVADRRAKTLCSELGKLVCTAERISMSAVKTTTRRPVAA